MFIIVTTGVVTPHRYYQFVMPPGMRVLSKILRWVIPVVLSKYEYVKNDIFVYSHKTQLCIIKCVYYIYYNDMLRPDNGR